MGDLGAIGPWTRQRLVHPGAHDAIDAAHHAKYDAFGQKIVGTVVGRKVRDVTLRLTPVAAEEN